MVLIKFNQNPDKNQDFKEHKLLTFRPLILTKDQLFKIDSSIKIDNVRKIIDLRNWVIHGYDKIDDVIIWGIISKHLPLLKIQVDELLK
jgi:hypothetical protein